MRRILIVALAITVASCSRNRLPAPGSPVYEDTTRAFYRGLAELQVGLLDDAKRDFGKATMLVPDEPAGWANLGLTSLRLGDFDAAVAPIEKAVSLAPESSNLVFLRGRMNTSRGKLDEGIADYRKAAALDAKNVRVRFALAEEIERAGGPNADEDAERQLSDILTNAPGNLAVMIERARMAAKRGQLGPLEGAVRALEPLSAGWPASAVEQFQGLKTAVSGKNFQDAARSVAFLRNVLVRVPAFRESLMAVRTPAELIADPFEAFVKMAPPSPNPSPADTGLSFTKEAAQPSTLPPATVELDWNRDFRMDYAISGKDGVRVFVQQDNNTYKDATPKAGALTADTFAVWTADIEMDGDLDLVAGVRGAAPLVLRNNGDGTWKQLRPFAGVIGARAFAWGDLDGDGDGDAVLVGEKGDLHVFENRQAGEFREMRALSDAGTVVAVAVADVNADGVLDIVTLNAAGSLRASWTRDGRWRSDEIARWPDAIAADAVGSYRLFLQDLDNNGALDVVVSGGGRTRAWIGGNPIVVDANVVSVVDVNNDGMLDLVAQDAAFTGKGTKAYHWQVIRPRAQPTAGDQRINSFGVGGEIEIRSGLLTQRQIIGSQPVHFGLGTRTAIDVARVFWPNGIMQADFDTKADQQVTAEQRLKGSCPWIFTWDGAAMRFVTDFLWRSPLGLRINAVDTAGVTQTEDWVKISGDQMLARNGAYDVRITAELWETHFVDHVSLLVVDHPDDTEVFVDERFAKEAPPLAIHTLTRPASVAQAWDDSGHDVTELVAEQDGRYLSTFARGAYQGIANDHFVEIDLRGRPEGLHYKWLVATGWIYPTDSSINVAIGQQNLQPHGLSLEAQDANGRWRVVSPDLGFPAGKNKTVLIDLSAIGSARRIRLRTNLEVYWDSLALADDASGATIAPVRIQPSTAELRYRGFSKTEYARHDVPETPKYDEIANVGQRWRDLAGYYTRYGDVRELLSTIDDRYVIMNAGDEIRFTFSEPVTPKRPQGAKADRRDFVLIGDGWVKDGDYNTTASKTVGPLPRHGHPEYSVGKSDEIEDDPVFKAHPQDWQQYHTRFVDPGGFLRGLR
jgi:hypothetical protein